MVQEIKPLDKNELQKQIDEIARNKYKLEKSKGNEGTVKDSPPKEGETKPGLY